MLIIKRGILVLLDIAWYLVLYKLEAVTLIDGEKRTLLLFVLQY